MTIQFDYGAGFIIKETINRMVPPTKMLKFSSPYQHMDELGFFCKWELKMDKKILQPIRFRLGSVDYVNRMEGK